MWNKNKSLVLSKVCVFIFAATLAVMDIGGYWLVSWLLSFTRSTLGGGLRNGLLLMTSLYLCSAPAWVLLISLKRLIDNLEKDIIFTKENTALLRRISICCVAAFVICCASALYYLPFGIISVSAGFMALIVHIVKNCFEQAACMKDELDYTV